MKNTQLDTKYLIRRLGALSIKIKAAAVYGSFARGTQTEDSDLDILLISDESESKKAALS